MAHIHGCDAHTKVVGLARGDRAEFHLRRHVVERHGKHHWTHLFPDDFGERTGECIRAPETDGISLLEKRSEERDSLDVIPVPVRQENVGADWAGGRIGEPTPKRANAAARVEHDETTVRAANFDAGRVTAVSGREWT